MPPLQNLINWLYRYPKSKHKTIKRFGGYLSYRKMLKGIREMQKACNDLPPIISHNSGFSIYFLTGKKYLYQTLFCALSLTKVCKETFQFVLIDDGSFDEMIVDRIEKQMPGVRILTRNEIEHNLNQKLPQSKFPNLHEKRKVYPHIKKLTDIHTIDDNYKLVLDSDMLFWNEPIEIINWLKNPIGCLYMLDCAESYGYPISFMETLCGADIPKLMNVGILGFKSSVIDWNKVENWVEKLEQNFGASYFLEQALSAMILAPELKKSLDEKQYIVNPKQPITSDEIKLHHYVDLSKKYYYENAWKQISI